MGLIGNKTDLEHQRIIKIENHNKVAEEYALEPYYSNFNSYLLSIIIIIKISSSKTPKIILKKTKKNLGPDNR